MRHAMAALLLVTATACIQPEAPELSLDAVPGQPDTVTLRAGQSVRYGPARITFAEVPEDSRCPVDVVCIWAGDAHVVVGVGPVYGRGATIPLHLHTIDAAHDESAWGVRVRLISIAPDRHVGQAIRSEDYRVTLEVTQEDDAP